MRTLTRTWAAGLVGLALLAAPSGAQEEPAPEAAPQTATLDKKAPPFTLTDAKGQERSLSDYEGRIVVLEWIDTDCPPVASMYRQGVMQKTYKAARKLDGKVAWLAINSTHTTNAAKNRFWINQHKLEYPILVDLNGAVGRRYDARRAPHMFVIDREGVLRYHGALDDNALGSPDAEDITNYVLGAIEQIVAEEPVDPKYVKPSYGCLIKRQR
jgi:peroxiredoxin